MPLELTPQTPPYYQIVSGPAPAGTKYYTALISQTGTSAPTLTILGTNDIGAIVWARESAGAYSGTLTAAFPNNKTFLTITPNNSTNVLMVIYRNDDNEIWIETATVAVPPVGTDALLFQTPFQIIVYP